MEMLETPALPRLKVATPCAASWQDMHGDERSRRCDHCRKRVFNLSGMTTEEAVAFVEETTRTKATCVRFFRRRDGTVLTKDCPRGLRDKWRHVEVRMAVVAAALFGAMAADYAHEGVTYEAMQPAVRAMKRIAGVAGGGHGPMVMGEIEAVDSNL